MWSALSHRRVRIEISGRKPLRDDRTAALGLPLVGTRRGAISEIISNGQTGLLVAEEVEDLAAAWTRLIAEPERRLEMGRAAARDASDRFRPDRLAAWMERFYSDLLK
ncbi:MAG TPA: glycosyltransferase [Myxococcales bacterium]|nr:glycosyltransferase [Myxococcales bacterium]HIK84998.1 glycosyltransferase [Myxococcales bacterium]